jgi:uncharacterized protein YndB with AHSA1/START domain
MPDTLLQRTQPDTITPGELRFERLLAAPPETVWRYIVEPDLRARWFMAGQIDRRAGGEMEMIFDHDRLSDGPSPMPEKYREHVGSRWSETISRIDPPHVIAFSWNQGKAGEVTIELSPERGGTRLVLTHRGIRGPADARNFGGGWRSHLAVLQARIAGQTVPDFWALHRDHETAVAEILGPVPNEAESGCRD